MKIYVYPADIHGCGYYRLIWASRELQRLGHDVSLEMPGAHPRLDVVMEGNKPKEVHIPQDADVMVFQRVTHSYLANAISIMRNHGVAVVVDVDDDLARLHTENGAFDAMHPRNLRSGTSQHSWHMLEKACQDATLVTTSTDTLAQRYAKHGRYCVIPNYIPRRYLTIPHIDTDMIGYPGLLSTHANDVEILGSSIARLMHDGHDFMTIGDTSGIDRTLNLPRAPISHGPADLAQWPTALTTIGIGLAPLADTEFNRSKSWLKMMEMAAVGVPCVGSPRREYMKLHKQYGIGVLAEKPKHWYATVRRLVNNTTERTDLSLRGYEGVRRLILEEHVSEWLAAWMTARDIEIGLAVPRAGR
jgi:hypothetical protein